MSESGRGRSNASRVFIGILLSRVVGFLRDRMLAHYFGAGAHADVFATALRGPNFLQNLLGEGTVSAAFIPIYSRFVEAGKSEEARRFAGALFGLLFVCALVLAVIGALAAPVFVAAFAPGFLGDAARVAAGEASVDRYPLAVLAVRIMFPMTCVLVLAAWSLGVLNSHRRFLLPYTAPVLWNAAIMAALFAVGAGLLELGAGPRNDRLLIAACAGAFVGALLQLAVQFPVALRLIGGLRPSLSLSAPGVRDALRAFGPVVLGRGVYQLSAYLDLILASLLATGAVVSLQRAQALYILPVSLFGMSVAAAELPELSRSSELRAGFVERLRASLRQIGFLTIPTAIGYLAFGFLLVGALYRTGAFGIEANGLTFAVLGCYALGLVATTWGRLMQNAFYAVRDTKTPARIAVLRVVVSTIVALPSMLYLDAIPVASRFGSSGEALYFGAAGLALGSAAGAWVELLALRRALGRRVEGFALPLGAALRALALALVSALPAWGVSLVVRELHVALQALVVVGVFAGVYLAIALFTRAPELEAWVGRLRRSRRH